MTIYAKNDKHNQKADRIDEFWLHAVLSFWPVKLQKLINRYVHQEPTYTLKRVELQESENFAGDQIQALNNVYALNSRFHSLVFYEKLEKDIQIPRVE